MRKKILFSLLIILFIFICARSVFSARKNKGNPRFYKESGVFSEAMDAVKKDYAEKTNDRDLIYGALKGMLESLDPHSQFMDPDTYEELKVETLGKFGGIGIEVTIKDGVLTVITPIQGTPAWKAGLQAGDRIIKIDDSPTLQLTLGEAVKKMRGRPGEKVILTISREDIKDLLEFKITRGIIEIEDVKYAFIPENRIGYIKINEFRKNTSREFDLALATLLRQGIKSLIIDLRNNPGGLLDTAIEVAGKFLEPDKLIAYTKGRRADQNLDFFSGCKNPVLELPLAVIINEGSASGSEIVAGALQDYRRAAIIGTKSFGKGSVQEVVPLEDGSALRLTTSHYFTPSGKIIQDKGILPDIQKEAKKGNPSSEDSGPLKAKEKSQNFFNYNDDPQIMRAIEALK
ncbi:MAG: S41 family peptidase [Candidatus Omnitrophica bacterium]|nr:S41 family peptidase [Candidatus Omnitrophota bacterium]